MKILRCGVVVVSLTFGLTATARAEAGADLTLTLSSHRPASASALRFHIAYHKALPLQEVRITAPEGTRFDGGAVPACTANDLALRMQAATACPPASRIGSGTIVVDSGCGPVADPFAMNLTPFNSGDGVLELATVGAQVVLAIERTRFSAPNEIRITPQPVTVCRPVSVREAQLVVSGGSAARPYVTTPPSCPASGLWTSRLSVRYSGDDTVHAATSTTPCERPARVKRKARRCAGKARRCRQR